MDIDTTLVAQLVGSQFPQWSGLPITVAAPNGWDNRTFRLGQELLVRLPSAERYAAQVRRSTAGSPRSRHHCRCRFRFRSQWGSIVGWLSVELVDLSLLDGVPAAA